MRTHVIARTLAYLPAAGLLAAVIAAAPGATACTANAGTKASQEATGRVKASTNDGETPLASDGKPAAPGRVPGGTEVAAQELWNGLRQSLTIAGANPKQPQGNKPRSFVLEFSMRQRDDKQGTIESPIRLSYLELGPGLVSGSVLDRKGKVKSTQMRGLSPTDTVNYWFRKYSGEGVTNGWIPRDSFEDRDEQDTVDSWAHLAYDIARLSEPDSMRLVEIKRRTVDKASDFTRGWLKFEGDPGIQLPPNDVEGVVDGRAQSLSDLCSKLEWVQVATPDFRLIVKGMKYKQRIAAKKMVKRLVFGVDPKSKRPQVVIVSPTRNEALLVPGAGLVQCTEWFDHGKTGPKAKVPGRFFAYEAVRMKSDPRGVAFSSAPSADLYMLDGGSMSANLSPKSFWPEEDSK